LVELVKRRAEAEQRAPKRGRGRPVHLVPSELYQTRKKEILDAAQEVFSTKGYAEGSLDDVARATNISKPTLYYYFPSKAHLFYQLTCMKNDEAVAKLAEISKIKDPLDRLRGLMRFQVEQVTGDMQFYRYFFDHRPPLKSKRLKAELRDKLTEYSQFFYDAVRDAIAAKVLPPIDEFVAAQAIFGATFWIYKWYDPSKYTVDEVLAQLLTMIGIPPASGNG